MYYIFKLLDIPDKIVLGKTVNGKNLVARVVKRNSNNYIRNNIPPDSSSNSTTVAAKAQDKETKLRKLSHMFPTSIAYNTSSSNVNMLLSESKWMLG